MNHMEKIREKLPESRLDAVLLTAEANRFYASGFHSSGTDGAALITEKGAYFFIDGRYTEAAGQTLAQNWTLRELRRGDSYHGLFNAVIEAEKLRRVGYEDAVMAVSTFARYRQELKCELLPASDLLKGLRQVKDAEELQALEGAQRIAERVLDDILREVRPGATEREIAARIQYLLLHYGASDKSFDPIVVSGANGSLPHGAPSEKAIQAGEFVTMDFGCIYRGYCSDMTRTVAVGYATEEMRTVYDIVLRAQAAGIAAAKAGVTGKDVDAAARDVISAAGYGEYFSHSFGHGVGIEIHEAPNASSLNDKPLPAGAVISAEPGIYMPGKFGVRIEDVIIVGETESRSLMKAPKDFIVLHP